jgi:hypothetical protein
MVLKPATPAFLLVAALAALAALLRGAPEARAQGVPDDYVVIVNPANHVQRLDPADLRDLFLRKAVLWGDGETARPVDLPRTSPVRERFSREVLGRTAADIRSYWNQQIFSGRALPPPEKETAAEVIAYVLRYPGGVGYLPASVDPGGARVVRVGGAPGSRP